MRVLLGTCMTSKKCSKTQEVKIGIHVNFQQRCLWWAHRYVDIHLLYIRTVCHFWPYHLWRATDVQKHTQIIILQFSLRCELSWVWSTGTGTINTDSSIPTTYNTMSNMNTKLPPLPGCPHCRPWHLPARWSAPPSCSWSPTENRQRRWAQQTSSEN